MTKIEFPPLNKKLTRKIHTELWYQIFKIAKKMNLPTNRFTATFSLVPNPCGLGHVLTHYIEYNKEN